MSVKVMAWVWDQELPTSMKMLLLAIADHADDEGDNAWPSKSRLAKKVGLSENRIRQMLRALEADGWIETGRQQGGTHRTPIDKRPNLYRIIMTNRGLTHEAPPATPPRRGLAHEAPRGITHEAPRGLTHEPLTISSTSSTSIGGDSDTESPRKRKADPLFDAMVEACSINALRLTTSSRGALNRAVKELREVGADPDQVADAARAYRLKYPEAAITPQALAKHFPALSDPVPVQSRYAAPQGSPCPKCSATGWVEADTDARTVERCDLCNGYGRVGT